MTDQAMKKVLTHVFCRNSEGAPEIYTTTVHLSQSDYDAGENYAIARSRAEDEGYEAIQAFDEFDPAGKSIIPENPAVLVWVGEGGVENVISDFPMRFVVVSTDTEHTEEENIFKIENGVLASGKTFMQEVIGHTGDCDVIHGEAAKLMAVTDRFHAGEQEQNEVAPLKP